MILNGLSDLWVNSCLYTNNKFITAISNGISRLIQFDSLLLVGFLTLLMFPVLFSIYSFGLQQKLRTYYNSLRNNLLKCFFIFSFSFGSSTVFHLLIQQPTPCVHWDRETQVLPLKFQSNSSKSPNEDIIIILVIFSLLWEIQIGFQVLIRLLAMALLLLFCAVEIYMGYSSILQVIISLFWGFWIVSFFKLMPPIIYPISGCLLSVVLFTLFGYRYRQYGWDEPMMKEPLLLSIRSSFVLLIYSGYIIHFGLSREDFKWFKTDLQGTRVSNPNKFFNALVPPMSTNEPLSDFGHLLNIDILVTFIGCLIYLIGNYVLYSINNKFNFMTD